MSVLFNNRWIGLDGAPITGRVPPSLFVYPLDAVKPPRQLTERELGQIAHHFKLFADVVANSPHRSGFHVQNRVLQSGVRVRMESNSEVYKVLAGVPPEDDQATRQYARIAIHFRRAEWDNALGWGILQENIEPATNTELPGNAPGILGRVADEGEPEHLMFEVDGSRALDSNALKTGALKISRIKFYRASHTDLNASKPRNLVTYDDQTHRFYLCGKRLKVGEQYPPAWPAVVGKTPSAVFILSQGFDSPFAWTDAHINDASNVIIAGVLYQPTGAGTTTLTFLLLRIVDGAFDDEWLQIGEMEVDDGIQLDGLWLRGITDNDTQKTYTVERRQRLVDGAFLCNVVIPKDTALYETDAAASASHIVPPEPEIPARSYTVGFNAVAHDISFDNQLLSFAWPSVEVSVTAPSTTPTVFDPWTNGRTTSPAIPPGGNITQKTERVYVTHDTATRSGAVLVPVGGASEFAPTVDSVTRRLRLRPIAESVPAGDDFSAIAPYMSAPPIDVGALTAVDPETGATGAVDTFYEWIMTGYVGLTGNDTDGWVWSGVSYFVTEVWAGARWIERDVVESSGGGLSFTKTATDGSNTEAVGGFLRPTINATCNYRILGVVRDQHTFAAGVITDHTYTTQRTSGTPLDLVSSFSHAVSIKYRIGSTNIELVPNIFPQFPETPAGLTYSQSAPPANFLPGRALNVGTIPPSTTVVTPFLAKGIYRWEDALTITDPNAPTDVGLAQTGTIVAGLSSATVSKSTLLSELTEAYAPTTDDVANLAADFNWAFPGGGGSDPYGFDSPLLNLAGYLDTGGPSWDMGESVVIHDTRADAFIVQVAPEAALPSFGTSTYFKKLMVGNKFGAVPLWPFIAEWLEVINYEGPEISEDGALIYEQPGAEDCGIL